MTDDTMLAELRQRLIHIEAKADGVLRRLDEGGTGYAGHPDQAFGCLTYAQFGEDLIILNIFRMLGMEKPSYLDVGAHHPFTISNTALLHQRGSRGINVEANPNLIEAFHRHRPEDINLNTGVGPRRGTLDFYFIDDWSGRNTFSRAVAEAFVRESGGFQIQKTVPIPVVTLNDVVDQHAGGRFPDLLSLDVEGLDLDILAGASFGDADPVVVCVEADFGQQDGKAAELTGLMSGRGFALYARTVANLIFVRQAALARFMA